MAVESFADRAGFVAFPRSVADLTSTSICPACFTKLASTICSNCALDVTQAAATELHDTSLRAAAALDQRVELIGRMRADAAAAALAAATRTVAAPPVVATAPTTPVPPASVLHRPVGAQVILLVVGVSLLAVGAIFFLVYAFITFGLIWRSVIIGAVTIAAISGATLLKRRRLRATAEAIAALATVFVYLDAFAVRANNFFGAADTDGLVYWGITLAVVAVGFAVLHRMSGLRLLNLVAFATVGPGIALLVAGLTDGLDGGVRVFVAFAALAVSGLVHPLARAAAPERIIALALGTLGLVGAGFTAVLFKPQDDWAPAVGLGVVALLALLHVVVVARVGAARPLGLVVAGIGGAAASVAGLVVSGRIDDVAVFVIAPALAAAVIALLLELIGRRATGFARRATNVAAWSAAGITGIALLFPLATALGPVSSLLAAGTYRWSVTGGEPVALQPESFNAVVALVVVIALAGGAWLLGGVFASRKPALAWAGMATLVLAAPLVGMLWLVIIAWLAIGAAAIVALVATARRGSRATVRVPLAVGGAVATALAWAASWASIDTWWYGSVGAVALLVAARVTTKAVPLRGMLLAGATVLSFVAIGSEGWHTSERFQSGHGAAVDSIHFVAALAILLVSLSAPLSRALSAFETRVLFWLSLVTGVVTAGISWWVGGVASAEDLGSLVLPEFATSVVLGAALVVALLVWLLDRLTSAFAEERVVASIALAPAAAWLVDSAARLLLLTPTARVVTVLLLFCALHVVGVLVNRGPFTAATGWASIGFAALTAIIAVAGGLIDPFEWATAAIAVALLVTGVAKLSGSATAGSWAWLAPGLLVLFLPSLLATFVEQPAWRLVGLGVACVVAVIIGAVARLKSPLVIGSVVVLVHAIRTFAPQLVAVYQLTEWWVWAVIGGGILLFLGLTFEKRMRDLRSAASRVSALR